MDHGRPLHEAIPLEHICGVVRAKVHKLHGSSTSDLLIIGLPSWI